MLHSKLSLRQNDLKNAVIHEAGHLFYLNKYNILAWASFSLNENYDEFFQRSILGTVTYDRKAFDDLDITVQWRIGLAGLVAELRHDDASDIKDLIETIVIEIDDNIIISDSDRAMFEGFSEDVLVSTVADVMTNWKQIQDLATSLYDQNSFLLDLD